MMKINKGLKIFLNVLWFWLMLGNFLCVSQVFATESGENSGTDDTLNKSRQKWFFDATLLEEYRFRAATAPQIESQTVTGTIPTSDETDHDLHLFASFDARRANNFRAEAAFGLWLDLDGQLPHGEPSSFPSLYDNDELWFDLYLFKAEFEGKKFLKSMVAGRQEAEYGPRVMFDGASVEVQIIPSRFTLFALGGRSVHFFSTDEGFFEDFFGSAGVVIRPVPELRIEADYRFLTEDTNTKVALEDHEYGMRIWYKLGPWFYTKAVFRGLNDYILRVAWDNRLVLSEGEFGASFLVDVQPSELTEVNERADLFFSTLGTSLPHMRAKLDLWKSFTTTKAGIYSFHLGWNNRTLLNKNEPTIFNRNLNNVYLWAEARDMGLKGLFVTLAVDYNLTQGPKTEGDQMGFSAGGSLGWKGSVFQGELGTYYQLFKYNYYLDVEELENVRTYFVKLKYKPLSWLSIKVRYEFEQFDRNLHNMFISLQQDF